MEITISNPMIKRISFDTYKKFFLNALKADSENYNEIYYKKSTTELEISFCSGCFVIVCVISYKEIQQMYKDLSPNDAASDFVTQENNPLLAKFYLEYLLDRGIPTE